MGKPLYAVTVIGIGALVAAVAPILVPGTRASLLQGPAQMAPVLKYRVVSTYPHDPSAYTQGLVYRNGFLFESTGRNGESSLRKVKLETGEVLQRVSIDAKYFAEGLADVGDQLVQLTWQSKVGFVYDLNTFRLIRGFTYPGEGWGLVHDGTRLIMSDGTPALRFLDRNTMRETGRVSVTDGGLPVERLNELEMVKGELFANIYQSDYVVIIAPRTGRVTGRIDFRGLLPASDRVRPVDVLNGIAYDPARDRLFVTGKWWPKLFEIQVVK